MRLVLYKKPCSVKLWIPLIELVYIFARKIFIVSVVAVTIEKKNKRFENESCMNQELLKLSLTPSCILGIWCTRTLILAFSALKNYHIILLTVNYVNLLDYFS